MMLSLLRAAACMALMLCVQAFAQEAPGADYRLDLDTDGHRGLVRDIAFTQDGRALVSASDDKTVRVWDVETGSTVRTIRGFAGDGHDGKVFALAVSPDGRTVAAGGFFGEGIGASPPYGDVRLFELATGRLQAVLTGNEYAVYALAFSPDGTRLAAGGQDGYVHLWSRDQGDGASWTEEARLDADSNHVRRIAFSADGSRLMATTADWGLRLWTMPGLEELELAGEAEALRETPVVALAASRDGQVFATGNDDGDVHLWRAHDGSFAGRLPTLDYAVGALAFTAGGEIVVTCGYRCAGRPRVEVWRPGGAAPERRYDGHDGSVLAAAVSPDGETVATAGGADHAIHLWSTADVSRTAALVGKGHPVTSVGLTADGSAIAWGSDDPCPTAAACPQIMGELAHRLDLPSESRFFEAPVAAGRGPYLRARHAAGAWSLSATAGEATGAANDVLEVANASSGMTRQIRNDASNGFVHASFGLLRRGLRLVTGGSDGTILEYYSATTRLAGEFAGGHTGQVNALAASERAGLLLTGSADQTLALWNLETRELIVSMLFAGSEWVVWMPQGYYYASPDGDRLIGWRVNQGRDEEARFVRAEQLKRHLYSPEMVRRAIMLRSSRRAVAEMRPGVAEELRGLLERSPPEFELRLADDQSGVRAGFVAVEIDDGPASGEATEFSVLSNYRNVGGMSARSTHGRRIVEVPVEEGENTISITATDAFGFVTERSVRAIGRKREDAPRGKLYVAVVGVSRYPELPTGCNGRPCDLRFPVDDAAEMLRTLKARTAPLFSEMIPLVLVNRDALDDVPERAAALASIVGHDAILEPEADTVTDELIDFLDRPGPEDTTIVFVAGHGINIDEDYYLIPSDGRRQDGDRWRRSSLVDWADIQKSMEKAAGMRFLMLDTCHAANAFNPRLEKDAADARIVVFSATAANNTALEMAELGHGVFTHAMLAGLRGQASTSRDGVTLFGLADFVSREVIRVTGARQKPFYYAGGVENVLLAPP